MYKLQQSAFAAHSTDISNLANVCVEDVLLCRLLPELASYWVGPMLLPQMLPCPVPCTSRHAFRLTGLRESTVTAGCALAAALSGSNNNVSGILDVQNPAKDFANLTAVLPVSKGTEARKLA